VSGKPFVLTPDTGHALLVELARVELAAETLQESPVPVTVSPVKWGIWESNPMSRAYEARVETVSPIPNTRDWN
jgi:hypothetical protein